MRNPRLAIALRQFCSARFSWTSIAFGHATIRDCCDPSDVLGSLPIILEMQRLVAIDATQTADRCVAVASGFIVLLSVC
jgi:hypothetical protein